MTQFIRLAILVMCHVAINNNANGQNGNDISQPYIVDVKLPTSATRNEVLSISMTVYNNLGESIDAGIILDNRLSEFQFQDYPKNDAAQAKYFAISAFDSVSFSFNIVPKILGDITISIYSRSAYDANLFIEKLTIVPEVYKSCANYSMSILNETYISSTYQIDIPTDAPETLKTNLSIVGRPNMMEWNSLDYLFRPIYYINSVSESSMLLHGRNVAIWDYLTTTNVDHPNEELLLNECITNATEYIPTLQQDNGGIGFHGLYPEFIPSTWLTAYVVKTFIRSKKYVPIDQSFLNRAIQYLINNQNSDGSFAEPGYVVHSFMQGCIICSRDNGALTVYITISLIEADPVLYKPQIDKALAKIVSMVIQSNDTYTLSMTAYVLQLAKHPKRAVYLSRLMSAAKSKDYMVWWEMPGQESYIYYEITAYGTLAFLQANQIANAQYAIKWLLVNMQYNSHFNFVQTFIVSLEAIDKFIIANGGSMILPILTVKVEYAQTTTMLQISRSNYLTEQSIYLPQGVSSVNVTVFGIGTLPIQLCSEYITE